MTDGLDQKFRFDRNRRERIGLEEAVFGASKTPAAIARIAEDALADGRRLLITRLSSDTHAALPPEITGELDYDPASRTAILGGVPAPDGPTQVALLTAGTSDSVAAAEAQRTLAYSGVACHVYCDRGVAGLWRLLDIVDELRRFKIVIVFAGMDAALPSVVGGLIPSAIIAVPTSVGYGVAEGGRSALESMLSSCAPGLLVVNIDNGYGAACAALRILAQTRSDSGGA